MIQNLRCKLYHSIEKVHYFSEKRWPFFAKFVLFTSVYIIFANYSTKICFFQQYDFIII
jgi:hypothetical protein